MTCAYTRPGSARPMLLSRHSVSATDTTSTADGATCRRAARSATACCTKPSEPAGKTEGVDVTGWGSLQIDNPHAKACQHDRRNDKRRPLGQFQWYVPGSQQQQDHHTGSQDDPRP